MTQKVLTPSKSPNLCSVIRVDEDIDFVLDRNDLEYSVTVPTDKNLEPSRKTYSKRNPITCNSNVHFPDNLKAVAANNISLKTKRLTSNHIKCPSNVPNDKTLRGKRKGNFLAGSSQDVIPKKLRKRNISTNKTQHQSLSERSTPQQKYKPRKCASLGHESSPDSDVEILEMKLFEHDSSRMKLNDIKAPSVQYNNLNYKGAHKESKISEDILNKKYPVKLPKSILKPCFSTNNEAQINEAATALIMPENSTPSRKVREATVDNISSSSSMKWLSANGTVDVSSFEYNNQNDTNQSRMKYAEKYNLFLPEMKVVQEKKASGKRELKGLYENLNEISWANEKSFKQLLGATDLHRHSERITAKVTGEGKNLRRLKAASVNKQQPSFVKKTSAAKILALKRAKYSKFKSRMAAKSVQNSKKLALGNKIKKKFDVKKNLAQKVISNKNLKAHKIIAGQSSKTQKIASNNSSKIQKNINSSSSKIQKINNNNSSKMQRIINNISKTQKVMNRSTKIQKGVDNISTKTSKLSSSSSMKMKASQPKINTKGKEINSSKAKSNALQMKSKAESVSVKENVEHSEPSCSGLQNNGKWKIESSDKVPNSSTKSSVIKNALKQLEKIEVSNEIELFRSILSGNNNIFSALQRGSKLRVTLEPLEHTNLWTDDFYEMFKKHVIEQAVLKSIEKRDQEAINCMFRELEESLINSANNVKVTKKKKPEEETLRSSVRQSEGAFRYKEIVVRKHQNYMQFVLVPNSCKQNSLTVEAMKELKDAFLLAKRDTNCRAVLLNSSGSYFCTGIDLSQLVGSNKKQIAEEMALTIKDLVLTLGTFTKPVVAAVNGTAVGFGVSLLTYCDVVLASDKATFCIPATRLGYIPEGGVTLTLPQVVGAGVATEMLLQGRRLTAEQALRHGLVSEVLWPTQLMNEVIPRLQSIVSQPLQVMEATKSMVRCHLWDKLKAHVEKEWRLLPPLWLGAQCQHNVKRTLQTGWLVE